MRLFQFIIQDGEKCPDRITLRVDSNEHTSTYSVSHPDMILKCLDKLEDIGYEIFDVGGITSEGPY